MKCEEIKELIMTDYIDGEIEPELHREIEGHLKICNQCRQFEEILRQKVIEPFKKAERIGPPEEIWKRIKRNIEAEKAKGRLVGLMDSLRAIFTIRKPVLAAVTIVTLLVVGVVFTQLPLDKQNGANAYLEEQISFLSYLDPGETNGLDAASVNLGTKIEEYFLSNGTF